jgi:hypothetical protein
VCSARGPRVGTAVAVADGVRAEAGQHLVRVNADPADRDLGGLLADLRAPGLLLGQPGDLFCLFGLGEALARPASATLTCWLAAAWARSMAASRSASAAAQATFARAAWAILGLPRGAAKSECPTCRYLLGY